MAAVDVLLPWRALLFGSPFPPLSCRSSLGLEEVCRLALWVLANSPRPGRCKRKRGIDELPSRSITKESRLRGPVVVSLASMALYMVAKAVAELVPWCVVFVPGRLIRNLWGLTRLAAALGSLVAGRDLFGAAMPRALPFLCALGAGAACWPCDASLVTVISLLLLSPLG